MTGSIWNIALGVGLGAYAAVDRVKTGRWRPDLRTRDGSVEPLDPNGRPRILVHGVSVGEVNAVAPLIRELTEADPAPTIVISAATETGFERARHAYGKAHAVVRFPLDFTWMMDRFLDTVDPDLVVLAELELWPGFLRACRRRARPVCLVNARIAADSYHRYRRARPVVRSMFRQLSLVACQSDEYRTQFLSLGARADRTHVAGNLKWDGVRSPENVASARELGRAMGVDPERPLIVAGSTGPGEEVQLIEALPAGAQLLLAPRKPERWDDVARLQTGMPRRTERPDGCVGEPPTREDGPPNVFLLDTIGELSTAYLLADVAFIGRSLIPMGGSNPLEAVALGKPTVIGPHHENFAGIVAELAAAGGISVSAHPMREISAWLANPASAGTVARAGLEVVARNRGAAHRSAALVIEELLRAEPWGSPAETR